jgi:ParB-like chromosome segregation protein Spo0J
LPAAQPVKEARQIEQWPISRLKPYNRNARTHSPEQVAQIAASIQEFGFTNPILVASDDGILAGHGRLQAARELAMATVPVVVLDHLTPAQRRAYVLADNKLALNAGWDDAVLVGELQALQADEFDLSLLGWSDDELAELLPDDDAPLPGAGAGDDMPPPAKLADRFGIPPFTVLNAREGWWQERKRQWLALGIQSELGRGGGMTWGINPDASPTRCQGAA